MKPMAQKQRLDKANPRMAKKNKLAARQQMNPMAFAHTPQMFAPTAQPMFYPPNMLATQGMFPMTMPGAGMGLDQDVSSAAGDSEAAKKQIMQLKQQLMLQQ